MAKYRKWFGGALGWVFGGPIGALVGLALGSVFDEAAESGARTSIRDKRYTRQGDFEVSLLVLASYVIKADGEVRKTELDYVRNTFVELFGRARANEAFRFFNEITKQNTYSLKEVCTQIYQNMDHPSRLQLMHFLFKIAHVDGHVDDREREMVFQIGDYLRISAADMKSLEAMYMPDDSAYYKILEIEETATDAEVKKAYRKMAKKYHPDRVQHLGEEYQDEAESKFRKVQEAYDGIMKKRKSA